MSNSMSAVAFGTLAVKVCRVPGGGSTFSPFCVATLKPCDHVLSSSGPRTELILKS